MKKIVLAAAVALSLFACKKEGDLDGNNVEYETTQFQLTEQLTFSIPNSIFTIPLNICWDIPFTTVAFDQMIPSANPNPYAHLVYDIKPRQVKMELLNISGCDFSMLDDVKIYMVDKDVNSIGDIVIYDENNPTAFYNAKLMASASNISNNVGSVLYPTIDPNITLDEFIWDQDFKIFMDAEIDKTFVEDEALIKTTLDLDVTLINDN